MKKGGGRSHSTMEATPKSAFRWHASGLRLNSKGFTKYAPFVAVVKD